MREHLPGTIRRLRERRQLTQEELASASGLSREFISRIESGRFSMTLDTLGALADAFAVRPAALLSMAYGAGPRETS
jgi:transcriptional regulator with XRE-family HTH domain